MRKNKIVVGIVFIVIMFFVVRHCTLLRQGFGGQASMLETFSSCCLYPLLRMQHKVVEPILQWKNRSLSIAELEKKVEDLQKKYDEMCAENIALKGLHQYAYETDELRAFNKRYALHNGCIAQILARHFSSNNQFFLVNAGTVHGIKKDMVAMYGNAIVGKVTQVYPWYCKVCLITDADCKVAACLPNGKQIKGSHKGVTGIHEGINDAARTNMRYVSHLESVHVGDDVFSSGEGLVFPKGFALGKVIAADKGDLFYTISVQPTLDFQTLCYCTLIAKEDIQSIQYHPR